MQQVTKIQVEILDTETGEFELITLGQEEIEKHLAFAAILREECQPFVVDTDPEILDRVIEKLGMDNVRRAWAQGPTLKDMVRQFVEGRTKTYQEVRSDSTSSSSTA
jgi:hypothetical protein